MTTLHSSALSEFWWQGQRRYRTEELAKQKDSQGGLAAHPSEVPLGCKSQAQRCAVGCRIDSHDEAGSFNWACTTTRRLWCEHLSHAGLGALLGANAPAHGTRPSLCNQSTPQVPESRLRHQEQKLRQCRSFRAVD